MADYSSLFVLTHYVGLYYMWSAAFAFIIGLLVNYLISISWVFQKSRKTKVWIEFLVFAIIGIIGLGLNELIIWSGCELLGLHYMIAKLISTAMVFFWNFLARKYILF